MKDKSVGYIKNREDLCHKCLESKDDIKVYSTYGRGYGSKYDNCNESVQLCNQCRHSIEEDLDKWFNETCEYEDYTETYKYEEKIIEFIKSLPVEGREIVENQTASGANAYYCDSQDWIDIELGIAEDEVYKRNGMYSPSEINAYKERFPTCKHVYLKVWSDGSTSSKCSIDSSVSGNGDFTCGLNICEECYYCDRYEKKDEFYQPRIEEQLIVQPKLVEMYEIFCPQCGTKMLKYKHELEDGDESFCDNCLQDLIFKKDKTCV